MPAVPIPWTLFESLGQKSILGVVVLLVWLVFFHLLVNVWLLCIFTSLLVVLGGWLGSRVALNANSLLYLEHFLPLIESPQAHTSTDSEQRLDREIQSAVDKVLRDFVSSWYNSSVSTGGDAFEWEVRNAMLEAADELKRRAKLVDRRALAQRVLELCGCHLQSFSQVRELQQNESHQREKEGNSSTLWSLYSKVDVPHPALANPAAQLCYSRALVDLLMHVHIPQSHLETRTGRYMVGELITCNVILPLVTRISNPDWLNLMIVDVFTKSNDEGETDCVSPQHMPPADLEESCSSFCELDPPITLYCPETSSMHTAWSSSKASLQDSSASSFQSQWTLEDKVHIRKSSAKLFPERLIQNTSELLRSPYRTSRLYGHIDCDLDLPSSDGRKTFIESLKQIDSEEGCTENFCDCISASDFCGLACLEEDTLGLLGKCFKQNIITSEPPSCPERTQEESKVKPLSLTQPGSPALDSTGFENLVIPATIQNLHIKTAKTQKTNSTPSYTLYTVKYETAADSEESTTDQPVTYHTVNRRYSEFLNLQARLEERPDLKKAIKNVKGPKKLFPDLPFGNADTDKEEARRSQLESFLRKLSTIPEAAKSKELREFLALNADARTSFQKKPSSSRIDKMVGNIVDTLKTAFPRTEPQSPTEEGDPQRKPRLRFSSKIAPALDVPDLRPKVIYTFSEHCSVIKGFSLTDLEGFLDKQEKQVDGVFKNHLWSRNQQNPEENRVRGTDTALADITLNILCLLMKDRWSWLCTENIQKTLRLLFGTFIERWIEVGIAHLTSAPCWAIYLRVLQDAVWPGGELPVGSRPDRTPEQREKTRLQCLQCLMQLFPELISDMLGSEKCKLVWEHVLESLQDPSINRHLVYCIFDLLLEFLVPEISKETFQRSLLQSLSGDVERTLSTT